MREGSADATEAEGATPSRRRLSYVTDKSEPQSGHISVPDLVDSLRTPLTAAIDDIARGHGRSAQDCPWLDHYLGRTRTYDAARFERLALRWLGHAPPTAEALRQAVVARARRGARDWFERGSRPGLPGLPATDSPAASIVQRLGRGRPLAGADRERMQRGFGSQAADEAVIHTDGAAEQVAAERGLAAFNVGRHIGLGRGRWMPGSPVTTALLAHEFAHARAFEPNLGEQGSKGPDHGAERHANDAALAATLGKSAPSGPASGLRLHGCTDLDITEDQRQRATAVLARSVQMTLTPDPGTAPIMVGQEVRFGYEVVDDSLSELWSNVDVSIGLRGFQFYKAGSGGESIWEAQVGGPRDYRERTPTSDGEWVAQMEVGAFLTSDEGVGKTGENISVWMERRITARTAEELAGERIDEVESVPAREFLDNALVQGAILSPGDQATGSSEYRVATTAANPTQTRDDEDDPHPQLSFQLVGGEARADRRFEWRLFTLADEGMPDHLGSAPLVDTPTKPAYDLGTGRSVSFPGSHRNLYVLECRVYEGDHQVDMLRYSQSVLDEAGVNELEKLEAYQERAEGFVGRFAPGYPIPVSAVHVSATDGRAIPLALYIGRTSHDSDQLLMVDLTPGLDPEDHTLEFTGNETQEVLDDFATDNLYPEGAVRFRVPANDLNIDSGDWDLQTDGATLWGALSGAYGWGAAILAVLGLLAAPFTEGTSVVGTLLYLSAGFGVAAGAASLVDRLNKAETSGTGVALDIGTIVANIFTAGSAGMLVKAGSYSVAGQSSRFILLTGASFASEALVGVLLSVDAAKQIDKILKMDIPAADKRGRVVQTVAMLIVTGALLGLSYRSLTETSRRLKENLGDIADNLSRPTRMTLGLLDDGTLQALRGTDLGTQELDRLVGFIRQDTSIVADLAANSQGVRRALQETTGDSLDDFLGSLRRTPEASPASTALVPFGLTALTPLHAPRPVPYIHGAREIIPLADGSYLVRMGPVTPPMRPRGDGPIITPPPSQPAGFLPETGTLRLPTDEPVVLAARGPAELAGSPASKLPYAGDHIWVPAPMDNWDLLRPAGSPERGVRIDVYTGDSGDLGIVLDIDDTVRSLHTDPVSRSESVSRSWSSIGNPPANAWSDPVHPGVVYGRSHVDPHVRSRQNAQGLESTADPNNFVAHDSKYNTNVRSWLEGNLDGRQNPRPGFPSEAVPWQASEIFARDASGRVRYTTGDPARGIDPYPIVERELIVWINPDGTTRRAWLFDTTHGAWPTPLSSSQSVNAAEIPAVDVPITLRGSYDD